MASSISRRRSCNTLLRPVLSAAMWGRIEPLLPPQKGPRGPPAAPADRGGRAVLVADGYPVAGSAGGVRVVADRAPSPPAVVGGRHLGSGAGRVAGRRGRRRWDRLAVLGGLHDHPGAPARRDRGEVVVDRLLAHRGRRRMTRIRGGARTNRTITPSAGPAAG